jgi:hypothetical protein
MRKVMIVMAWSMCLIILSGQPASPAPPPKFAVGLSWSTNAMGAQTGNVPLCGFWQFGAPPRREAVGLFQAFGADASSAPESTLQSSGASNPLFPFVSMPRNPDKEPRTK